MGTDEGYNDLFVKPNPWNALMIIIVIPMSVFLIVLFIGAVKYQIHKASADLAGVVRVIMVTMFIIPFIWGPIVYAILYPLGFVLRWVRDGETQARYIARIGVFCGVFGIACQTVSASLS